MTLEAAGDKPETVGGMLGRIAAGIALLILGGALAIAWVVALVVGIFIPAVSDWMDILGDLAPVPLGIGLAIAIAGFELMRRGRKARNAVVGEVVETAASFTAEPTAHTDDYVAPPPPQPLV